MDVIKLKTVADLNEACLKDERIELIDGEIVKRPMARFGHSMVQSGLSGQFFPLWSKGDDDGWWVVTEVSVRYSEHHWPSHDLAGWQKSRVPHPPGSVMDKVPDWVCEITSPGHERKHNSIEESAIKKAHGLRSVQTILHCLTPGSL